MALIQETCKEKLILKPKIHRFNTTNASNMNTFSQKMGQIIGF